MKENHSPPPESSQMLVDEIRQLKVMFEEAAVGCTPLLSDLLSSLNDSLVSSIDGAADALREVMRAEFVSLTTTSQRIESNTEEILQLIHSHLLTDNSQALRTKLLTHLTLPFDELSISSTQLSYGFGNVFLGTYRGSTSVVAIKEIQHTTFSISERSAVEDEVLLMDSCRSPHTLLVYGFTHVQNQNHSSSFICTEFAPHGSLSRFLQFHPLPTSLIMVILFDLISAIQFLHSKGVIHRDIQPESVLMNESLHCKLTNFSLAKDESSRLGISSSCSNVSGDETPFLAPEVVNGHGSSPQSDIYSFGVTSLHIFSGVVTARGRNSLLVDQALLHLPHSLAQSLRLLIHACLCADPSKRPSAHEIRSTVRHLVSLSGGDPRIDPHHLDRVEVEEIKQKSLQEASLPLSLNSSTLHHPLTSRFHLIDDGEEKDEEEEAEDALSHWIQELFETHPRLKG
jgi:serine/threonine protein kinase